MALIPKKTKKERYSKEYLESLVLQDYQSWHGTKPTELYPGLTAEEKEICRENGIDLTWPGADYKKKYPDCYT